MDDDPTIPRLTGPRYVQCTLCKSEIDSYHKPLYGVVLASGIDWGSAKTQYVSFCSIYPKVVTKICKDCIDAMHEMGFINDSI